MYISQALVHYVSFFFYSFDNLECKNNVWNNCFMWEYLKLSTPAAMITFQSLRRLFISGMFCNPFITCPFLACSAFPSSRVHFWNVLQSLHHVSISGMFCNPFITCPFLACSVCTLCNSYTMGCPPVRGDNPRALASGLSYVQVDKHGITILYHLHQCRPCTSQDISC